MFCFKESHRQNMRINKKLLPIKAHFFFFMAAMGPILPQLPVIGKDLGISTVVMGTVTGILPFTFLLTKPLFGVLVDVHRDHRKTIFMILVFIMSFFFGLIYFIPSRSLLKLEFKTDYFSLDLCTNKEIMTAQQCTNVTIPVTCTSNCLNTTTAFLANRNHQEDYRICKLTNVTLSKKLLCTIICNEDIEADNGCWYKSLTFWSFIIFMSVGTIGFNVINSISDAICFDIVDNEYHYGKQRLWGSIGFGLTALLAGYVVNIFSESSLNYAPAFIAMFICSIVDLLICIDLELPVIAVPMNIFRDVKLVLINKYVITFITFTVLAGILDSLIIYFLFWYLEELAITTSTTNIKLIEGLIVAAETLGAEVIFFSLSGKILERFGHVHCFTMCFINYAIRLGLISIAPSPWWILPIEFFMQGPTYALTYTTIVAYANELAPPGASATMQGIAAGMGDGTGYAIGSIIGGLLYTFLGGKNTFVVFTGLAVICGALHFILHQTILKTESHVKNVKEVNKNDYERID